MSETSGNSRLEAFCDGVFAIALTLLIIDIKLPIGEKIENSHQLWLSLLHLLPSVFAFLISFAVVFIAWVNHHGILKLIHKSSSPFIYANAFLLLTIVFLPFPTNLLSENMFTDHAVPAVVVYASINALQAFAWILIGYTIQKPDVLAKNSKSLEIIRSGQVKSYLALVIYIVLGIAAFWFPQIVACLLGVLSLGWLIYGIRLKENK